MGKTKQFSHTCGDAPESYMAFWRRTNLATSSADTANSDMIFNELKWS